jgi:hypothetical protein
LADEFDVPRGVQVLEVGGGHEGVHVRFSVTGGDRVWHG